MPPKTEVAIARIAKETQDAHIKQAAQGGMPRPMSHGFIVRRMAEKVSLAQQVANARLVNRYVEECVPADLRGRR
jgi:hypothetical protein